MSNYYPVNCLDAQRDGSSRGSDGSGGVGGASNFYDVRMWAHTHTHTHKQTSAHTHIHTLTHMHTHTETGTHKYTHIHTWAYFSNILGATNNALTFENI
jgi:hypothetical protein